MKGTIYSMIIISIFLQSSFSFAQGQGEEPQCTGSDGKKYAVGQEFDNKRCKLVADWVSEEQNTCLHNGESYSDGAQVGGIICAGDKWMNVIEYNNSCYFNGERVAEGTPVNGRSCSNGNWVQVEGSSSNSIN